MQKDMVKRCFARYEVKYLITEAQQEALRSAFADHMKADEHPKYTIRNLYCDTDNFRMIRDSLDKPDYKEKLRLRSYGLVKDEDTVFLEMKKKMDGMVFKRRIVLGAGEAMAYLGNGTLPQDDSQILREIDYMRAFYAPKPKIFLAYDREAWAGIEDTELRLTFDTNLRWRRNALDLRLDAPTRLFLPRESVLLEIKTPSTIPLWLTRKLNALGIRQTSFSKYGTCFRDHILPALAEEQRRKAALKTQAGGQTILFPLYADAQRA